MKGGGKEIQKEINKKESHTPLDFIVVDDELFFQHFDGIQVVRLLLFGQHDFTEVTLTQHGQKIEVVKADFAFPGS